MNIVTSQIILNSIAKIDIFRLDLGFNLKGPAPDGKTGTENNEFKLKIKDNFIKKLHYEFGKIIYRYGDIGQLKFYHDPSQPKEEIHVYMDEEIYEVQVTISELQSNPREYLSNLLENIHQTHQDRVPTHSSPTKPSYDTPDDEYYKVDKNKYREYISTVPSDEVVPPIDMPREQYIESLLNRRKKLA
jgi:hypothetical protein